MVAIDGTDYQMSHYEEVLYEARKKGETIANKYIFELYTILREEEHLPPEDCRAKIEQDCMDLWSKATIMKFLPNEAKNPKKSKAGKVGAEQKKKLKEEENSKSKSVQIIEQSTNGSSAIISSQNGARTNLAENDSVRQEEEESRRSHSELNQELERRTPSPELLEAVKIISQRDQRIKELECTISQQSNYREQMYPELYLPHKLAQEIHDIVNENHATKISKIDFILHHDGNNIISVESLSSINSHFKSPTGAIN
jgi:hypothetical protein